MSFLTPQDTRFAASPETLNWQCETFDALQAYTLYRIIKARVDVFVVEQNCPYPELDDEDQAALHVQGYGIQGLAGYARILPPDADGQVFIGRILTTAPYRGRGVGKTLMAEALRWAAEAYPNAELCLAAQAQLEDFYACFGFAVSGPEYLEDNILHVPMRRAVGSKTV